MLTFSSIIQRSISEYNKDPVSEGSIIKVFQSWSLSKIIRKFLLDIDYDEKEMSERIVLWKKYNKTVGTKKIIMLQNKLSSDMSEIYTTLSMLREEESKILDELPQQFRKIPGSIGVEVYE